MHFSDVLLIGIALSMDACALTFSNCTVYNKSLNKKKEWSMPIAFAIFQGIMPLIGYFLGYLLTKHIYLSAIGEYLVAGVFYVLAIKIVIDILKSRKKEEKETANEFTFKLLLIQAVATSIDAFFVGITMSLSLTFNVFLACSIIALTTFGLVAVCLLLGKYIGKVLGKYAEWAGALILFLLATKNLLTALL